MRAHYLQHVPFEGLGSIEQWLNKSGYQISKTRLYEASVLPDPEEIDLLIVMGGPMSANDEDEFPWLIPEKRFIREVVDLGTSVLGICLGAQLIANTFEASVYQNAEKEIGWFPIQGVPSVGNSTFIFPSLATVFHWHGETFDLPAGATLLARSEGCDNQAFQINTSVIGLQFHLETTPKSAYDLLDNCRDELTHSKYIQTETEILSAKAELYVANNKMMGDILSYLTQNRG